MLSLLLLISYTILVLVATLFPFELVIAGPATLTGIVSAMEWDPISRFALRDIPRNVVLFIPIGLGLAHKLRKWNTSGTTRGLVVLAAGGLLSLSIEVIQQFIPYRFSAVADILANAGGAGAGFAVYSYWGDRAVKRLGEMFQASFARVSGRWLAAAVLIYAASVLVGLAGLQRASRLDNWDSAFPLILGNEQTGDRPWQGTITELFFASQSFDAGRVEAAFRGDDPLRLAGDSLLALYHLSGRGPYADQIHRLPELAWQPGAGPVGGEHGASLQEGQWLETKGSVEELASAVRQTSQLTLSLVLATASPNQTGPARIISISTDPFHRNLTLGQEGDDLVIRLRNNTTGENARHPEILVPRVFAEMSRKHLILTYDGTIIRLYIDRVADSRQFAFSPEVNLSWQAAQHVLPEINSIPVESASLLVIKWLFYWLLALPLVNLLIAFRTARRAASPAKQQR